MVLLLYLWENVKKWSSHEEMRENQLSENNMSYEPKSYGREQDYQQMGGLRRLDSAAIRTHFYPEGGWGWIVCACAFLAHVTTSGAQLSAGALHIVLVTKFPDSQNAHWVGPFSWSVSSVCSPLVVNLCRRKNVRILSLIGGFLFPLSLLCTSFTVEIHQFFFSFGVVGGIGSCLVRESSGIVLGEYFRRRRQFVEQVLAGTGVGVTLFSLLYLSLTRHIEWAHGFRIGAALSLICAVLPAFYRAAAIYHPHHNAIQQLKEQKAVQARGPSSFFIPLGSDICHSLNLFCVPSLKPILWSVGISSFGLFTPCFLMTHLGLGLSLGVILGAILTLKKFRCCRVSPRMLCCSTGILTGLSMIAISSVQGYYGYSLSAWIYGIALGSYLYTLKTLTMDLTRTKHWERIWSLVQSLMGPGVLIGTGVTSYLGKSGFYACATCVLLGAGIIGMELIDLSKCGSPQLSSVENESPIPPAPPPILPNKYGTPHNSSNPHPTGFYPLRRSMSLQQPIYSFCPDAFAGNYNHAQGYSPYCADCNPPGLYPSMVRSFSLPQPHFKNTGTQTNPNSPERNPYTGRYDNNTQQGQGRLQSAQKNSVMFNSNPQLFPQHDHVRHYPQQIHIPLQHPYPDQQQQQQQQSRSNRSSSERFPDIPIEPQFTSAGSLHQQQEPAFTRHYFDSSQMVPQQKKNESQSQQNQQQKQKQEEQQRQQQQQQISAQQQQQIQNTQRTYAQNQQSQQSLPFVSNQQLPFAQNQNFVPNQQQPLSVQNHCQIGFVAPPVHSVLKNHSQNHHQQQQQQQPRSHPHPQPQQQQQLNYEPQQGRDRKQYPSQAKQQFRISHFQDEEPEQYLPAKEKKPQGQDVQFSQKHHRSSSHQQQFEQSRQPVPYIINTAQQQHKSGVLNPQIQSFLQNQPYYFSQNQPFVLNAQQQQHSFPQSFQLPTLQHLNQTQSQVNFDPSRNVFTANQHMMLAEQAAASLHQHHQRQSQSQQPQPDSYFYNNSHHLNQGSKKLSSAEFEVEEPRFHSLRRQNAQMDRQPLMYYYDSNGNSSAHLQRQSTLNYSKTRDYLEAITSSV